MRLRISLFCFGTILALSLSGVAYAQVSCPDLKVSLKIGDRGNDVETLQRFLISKGFNIPALTERNAAYGFFGEETKAAVTGYQGSVDVKTTGLAGPLTRGKIKLECQSSVPTTPISTPTPTPVPSPASTSSGVFLKDSKSSNTLVENETGSNIKATFEFQFAIENQTDADVYIGNKVDNSVKVELSKGSGAVSLTLISSEPKSLIGDTGLSYVIPKNSSRNFSVSGRVDNTNGEKGVHKISLIEIPYSSAPSLDMPRNISVSGVVTEFILD